MNKWNKRLSIALFLSVIIYVFSLYGEKGVLVSYINNTFLIGFFLLILSGWYFVTSSGFFSNFTKVFKQLFTKDDLSVDKTHWSYDKDPDKEIIKRKKKNEIFLFYPLTISIILILQSTLLLFVYYR